VLEVDKTVRVKPNSNIVSSISSTIMEIMRSVMTGQFLMISGWPMLGHINHNDRPTYLYASRTQPLYCLTDFPLKTFLLIADNVDGP